MAPLSAIRLSRIYKEGFYPRLREISGLGWPKDAVSAKLAVFSFNPPAQCTLLNLASLFFEGEPESALKDILSNTLAKMHLGNTDPGFLVKPNEIDAVLDSLKTTQGRLTFGEVLEIFADNILTARFSALFPPAPMPTAFDLGLITVEEQVFEKGTVYATAKMFLGYKTLPADQRNTLEKLIKYHPTILDDVYPKIRVQESNPVSRTCFLNRILNGIKDPKNLNLPQEVETAYYEGKLDEVADKMKHGQTLRDYADKDLTAKIAVLSQINPAEDAQALDQGIEICFKRFGVNDLKQLKDMLSPDPVENEAPGVQMRFTQDAVSVPFSARPIKDEMIRRYPSVSLKKDPNIKFIAILRRAGKIFLDIRHSFSTNNAYSLSEVMTSAIKEINREKEALLPVKQKALTAALRPLQPEEISLLVETARVLEAGVGQKTYDESTAGHALDTIKNILKISLKELKDQKENVARVLIDEYKKTCLMELGSKTDYPDTKMLLRLVMQRSEIVPVILFEELNAPTAAIQALAGRLLKALGLNGFFFKFFVLMAEMESLINYLLTHLYAPKDILKFMLQLLLERGALLDQSLFNQLMEILFKQADYLKEMLPDNNKAVLSAGYEKKMSLELRLFLYRALELESIRQDLSEKKYGAALEKISEIVRSLNDENLKDVDLRYLYAFLQMLDREKKGLKDYIDINQGYQEESEAVTAVSAILKITEDLEKRKKSQT